MRDTESLKLTHSLTHLSVSTMYVYLFSHVPTVGAPTSLGPRSHQTKRPRLIRKGEDSCRRKEEGL